MKFVTNILEDTASEIAAPDAWTADASADRGNPEIEDLTPVAFTVDPAPAAHSLGKRLFDVVLAAGSLVVLGLPLVIVGLAIRAGSPGPAIFRQTRTGLSGRPFEIWKLRTMVAAEDDAFAPAERGDARITPLGAFLRRWSLDELPQLINVLRGDMSLVGPRPHAVEQDQQFARLIPEYGQRFRVRPGITGLAQINDLRGGGELDIIRKRVAMDLRYIETWSVGQDVKITLLTPSHLLGTKEAF